MSGVRHLMSEIECPFCGEENQSSSLVCRYCKRGLPSGESAESSVTVLARFAIGVGVAATALNVVVRIAVGSNSEWLLLLGFLSVWFGVARLVNGNVVIRYGVGFFIASFTVGLAATFIALKFGPR